MSQTMEHLARTLAQIRLAYPKLTLKELIAVIVLLKATKGRFMTTALPRRRRRTGIFAIAIAAALTASLTGCANTDDATADTPAGLLPAAEDSTQYPLTLDTWAGESVIEERPERVALIGFSPNLDALQALDVTPVYSIADDVEGTYRDEDWFSEIEFVDTATRSDPINVEAIAATEPDLIVAVNAAIEDDFERLSEIAPVVAEEEIGADKIDWREGQRLVGEALDLPAAAEQAITEAEDALAATAAEHPEFDGKTITMAYNYGAEYGTEYYTVTGGTAEEIMVDLGFDPNPLAEEFISDPAVSDENQSLLDADVLMMIYADDEVRDTHEAMPLFQQLDPVAEGRYASLTFNENENVVSPDGTEMPNAVWVMRRGASAVSLPWAVDVIANQWLNDADLD